MRFGLLGNLEVRGDDDVPVDLGGVQPRRVLALLLAAPGRVVPVDRVIEELWGDEVPASASGTLQSYISRLRRVLEPDRQRGAQAKVLIWEPPGYRLVVDAEDVDFRRFERLAREGRELLGAGQPAEARERLLAADALWRGDALVEFADQDFARGVVARLGEDRLAAIEDRVAADLELGRHAAIVGDLRELLDRHHLREGLWGHLALALYRSGRQAEALRVLSEMREVLLDELGVDPSPPLRELEQRILDHDPSLVAPERASTAAGPAGDDAAPDRSPSPAPAATVTPVTSSAGFVGREREVDLLDAAIDDAFAGRARFVVIEGDAGIGKTRLLEELELRAQARGAVVAWGRCREGGNAPSLWPWLEILRSTLDQLPPVPITDEEGLRPLLGPFGGGSPLADERFVTDRFSLFNQTVWNIEQASGTIPLVFLIDDLQWSDPASLDLVEHLAGSLAAAAVVIAVAVRPVEIDRDDGLIAALAAISRLPNHARISLRGLSADETRRVVAHEIGHEPLSQSVEAIHQRAEGNPFFIGELTRLVIEDPDTSADDLIKRRVPTAVGEVVRRRLGLLPAETNSLLEAAAVIGRDAELGVLARVADLDLETCLDAAQPALAHHVLVEPPGAIGTLRFAHALVQEAVLSAVPTRRRAQLHRAAAAAILALSGETEDTAEIIAHHLWEAVPLGGRREAAAALERAATVAEGRYAYESAVELLAQAVHLRGASGSEAEDLEAELLAICRLAEMRRRVYGYSGAVDDLPLERARQLAERTGRVDLLAELLWAEWAGAKVGGDSPVARKLAEHLHDLGRSTDDPIIRRLGLGVYGIYLAQVGRAAEGGALLDESLGVERDAEGRLGVPVFISEESRERDLFLYGYWCLTHEAIGDLEDGTARFDEIAVGGSGPYYSLAALNFDSYAGALTGDVQRAARSARRVLAADPDNDFPFFTGGSALNLAWALSEMGEIEEAVDLYEQYLPIMVSSGIRTGLPLYQANHALVLLRAGQMEAARAALARADEEAIAMDEMATKAILEMVRAELLAAGEAPPSEVALVLAVALSNAEENGAMALARRVRRAVSRLGVGEQVEAALAEARRTA